MADIVESPFSDMTLCMLVAWQGHSLSTVGSYGSNRLLLRRQMLADKTETDACSGSIAKHHHATLAAEYFAAFHTIPLCLA